MNTVKLQVRDLATDGIPEVPSPVFDGAHVYMFKNGGLPTTIDVTSGKTIDRKRTRGPGTHYAFPLIADNKLYTFAGNGRISVLEAGPSPHIPAINDPGENVYATPEIDDRVIYVRTHSAMYAFGETVN